MNRKEGKAGRQKGEKKATLANAGNRTCIVRLHESRVNFLSSSCALDSLMLDRKQISGSPPHYKLPTQAYPAQDTAKIARSTVTTPAQA